MRGWEAKVEELVTAEDGERDEWARGNRDKARKKLQGKKENVEQPERTVQRLEDWVDRGRK